MILKIVSIFSNAHLRVCLSQNLLLSILTRFVFQKFARFPTEPCKVLIFTTFCNKEIHSLLACYMRNLLFSLNCLYVIFFGCLLTHIFEDLLIKYFLFVLAMWLIILQVSCYVFLVVSLPTCKTLSVYSFLPWRLTFSLFHLYCPSPQLSWFQ